MLQASLQFYTKTHQHYCGIDLHARTMCAYILNQAGVKLVHRNNQTDQERLLTQIAPYRVKDNTVDKPFMKCMRKIIFITIWLYSSCVLSRATNGFDEICQIYSEVLNSSMRHDDKSKYLFDSVANRVTAKDALQAHSAIFLLPPEERYAVFKESAEHSLGRKWECSAMHKFMKN